MKVIKIGFVGAGNVAQYYFSAVKYNGLFEICGIYDKEKNVTKNFESIPICNSLDDLLNSKPDVVAILTKSTPRYEIAKKIITKRISVILEKPPVETIGQLDDLIKLSLKNNSFVFGALHSRYTSTHIFVRSKIKVTEAGTSHEDLGRLTKIELNRFDPYVENGKLKDSLPEKTSGLDSWPNIFAELALFVENYKIIKASNLDDSFSPGSTEVKSEIEGEISGGGVFIGRTDWTLKKSEKISTLTFEKGLIIMDHTSQKVFIEVDGSKKEIADFNYIGGRMECEYVRMLNEIYDVCTKIKKTNNSITRKILLDTMDCLEKIKK